MTTDECTASINSFLALFGQPGILVPASGTENERLSKLFDLYVEALLSQVPGYRQIPDRTMIPDTMAQMLVGEMRARKMI